MAAGDRNKDGKPKDIVRHIWAPMTNERDRFNEKISKTLCGRKDIGYAEGYEDTTLDESTCLKCKKKYYLMCNLIL